MGGGRLGGRLLPKLAKLQKFLGSWRSGLPLGLVIGLRCLRRVGLLSRQHPAQPGACSGAANDSCDLEQVYILSPH